MRMRIELIAYSVRSMQSIKGRICGDLAINKIEICKCKGEKSKRGGAGKIMKQAGRPYRTYAGDDGRGMDDASSSSLAGTHT
jgi:hypothetical protein